MEMHTADAPHELEAVEFDALPLPCCARTHIGRSREAELVLTDSRLGVAQVSARGQANEQHPELHMEADATSVGRRLISHCYHDGFAHVLPQPGDVWVDAPPMLTSQPCNHAGFHCPEVADDELSACAGDKGGTNQLRQHVRRRTVPLLNGFVIAAPDACSCLASSSIWSLGKFYNCTLRPAQQPERLKP